MRVVVIDGPAPAVSLEEAKRHLRIFETDGDGAPLPSEDDSYVEALIAAAQGHIDGPAGRLGRAVGVQTLELLADAWPRRLPCRPVIEVISATIEGEEIAGVIVEPDGLVRGPPCNAPGSIRIRYRAGYGQWRGEGDGRELVTVAPAPLKQAILLMVGHWFANREAVVTGTIATEIPMAVETLLWPYHLRVA